jgi:hypothetical protein
MWRFGWCVVRVMWGAGVCAGCMWGENEQRVDE